MTESQQYCSVVRFEWCCKVIFCCSPEIQPVLNCFLKHAFDQCAKSLLQVVWGVKGKYRMAKVVQILPSLRKQGPSTNSLCEKKSTGLRLP